MSSTTNVLKMRRAGSLPAKALVYVVDESSGDKDGKNLAIYAGDLVTGAPYQKGDRPIGTIGGAIDDATTKAANAAQKSELAAPTGAGEVGYDWAQLYAENTGGWGLQTASNAFHIFKSIPPEEWQGITNRTSTFDCTDVLKSACANYPVVFVPEGLFFGRHSIPVRNCRLMTAGYRTEFRRLPGQPAGTRFFLPLKNSYIGDFTYDGGGITADGGEQDHAVLIQATPASGDIFNIEIGSIRAFNVQGDVVAVARSAGGAQDVTNVRLGHIYGDNIWRNVVSIIGGDNGYVKSITGTRVGFYHFNAETNAGWGSSTNWKVDYIKGRMIGFIGATPTDFVGNIEVVQFDLNPANSPVSSPPYPAGLTTPEGMTYRNCEYIKIGTGKIRGFDGPGINVVIGVGEIGVRFLDAGNVDIRECLLNYPARDCYIVSQPDSRMRFGRLTGDLTVASKSMFSQASNISIGSTSINLALATNRLFNSCTDCTVDQTLVTGAGRPINNSTRVALKNGTVNCAFLAGGSADCTFENLGITATTLFTSGQERHTIANSVVNASYVALSNGLRPYVAPKKLTGTTSATPNTGSTIAHGLGYVPTQVSLSSRGAGTVYQSAAADATNITVAGTAASLPFDAYVV